MFNSRDISMERSLVVQGRVDIVKLAEIFAALNGELKLRTMSSLISACVEVLHNVLESNSMLDKRFDSLPNAYHLLVDTGIMSKSMQSRNKKKFELAWGFENMRKEGDNPEFSAPGYYNKLHNTHSVEPVNIEQTSIKNSKEGEKETLEYLRQQRELREKLERVRSGESIDDSPVVNNTQEKATECIMEVGPTNDISEEQKLINNVENAKTLHKKTGDGSEYNKAIAELNAFRAKNSVNSKGKFEPARKKTSEENNAEDNRINKKDREYFKLINSDAMLRPEGVVIDN